MQKMLLFCAIVTLVGCSTAKEIKSVQAKRLVQSWLQAMETNQPQIMHSMLVDKKNYSIGDMEWLIDIRQREIPMTLWHQSLYWKVDFDSKKKCYTIIPHQYDDSSNLVGTWPIAVVKKAKGWRIDLANSSVDFIDCDREDEDPSKTKATDYSRNSIQNQNITKQH